MNEKLLKKQENVLWEKKKVNEDWTKSKLLESLSLSKEELLRSIKSEKIAALVKSAKESILSKLFELEDVNTIEDLENLFEELLEIENFEEFIKSANENIFNKVLEYDIKTKKDLLELLKNKYIFYAIMYADEKIFNKIYKSFNVIRHKEVLFFITFAKKKNLEKIFKLKDFSKKSFDSEKFERLSKNIILVEIIRLVDEEIFEKVWNLFEIKTVNDLEELVEYTGIVKLLLFTKKKILKKIFKLKDLNKEALIKLTKNEKLLNIIRYTKEENLDIIWNFFNIETVKGLLNLTKIGKIDYFM